MKRAILITTLGVIVATIIYLMLAENEPTHEIGKVEVKGVSSVYFELEQENDFDMATAIYYGIFDNNGKTIAPSRFLVGTHDYINSPENFEANSVDNIIYLTFADTTTVYAVYDLIAHIGYPSREEPWQKSILVAETLLHKIQTKKPYLKGNWNE